MSEYVGDFLWHANQWSYERFRQKRKELTWDWDDESETYLKQEIAVMLALAPPEKYDYSTSSKPVSDDFDDRKI